MEMDVDSPKEKIILEYSWKSSVDSSSITEEDVNKLRGAELSDAEIVEIQEVIAIGLGFNTFFDSLIAD